jgi:hypothetical protein
LIEMLSPTPPSQRSASLGEAPTIRGVETADIPAVARLFQTTFVDARKPAPASLADYMNEVFVRHPWLSEDIRSRVAVDAAGRLQGFVGVIPQRLLHQGKPLRGAVLGALMVEKPDDNPLVGARLLRSAMQGGQDVSLSESANPVSQKMWELIGGTTLAPYSLNWVRLLRPAALPFSLLGRTSVARACAIIASPIDAVLNKIPKNPFAPVSLPAPTLDDVEAGVDDFIAAMPALIARYALRPDWDEPTLRWQLGHAAVKERFGALQCRLLRKGKKTVGSYLYYGRPGGVGFILQTLALPGHDFAVASCMLSHAASDGCAAVRGRAQPEFLDALMRHHALMFHRSSMVVHTKDKDLSSTLRLGDALATGLAAEAWSRLIGGAFS